MAQETGLPGRLRVPSALEEAGLTDHQLPGASWRRPAWLLWRLCPQGSGRGCRAAAPCWHRRRMAQPLPAWSPVAERSGGLTSHPWAVPLTAQWRAPLTGRLLPSRDRLGAGLTHEGCITNIHPICPTLWMRAPRLKHVTSIHGPSAHACGTRLSPGCWNLRPAC